MEKEENFQNTSTDQNQDTAKETTKPEENLSEENKQEKEQNLMKRSKN